MPRPSIVLVFTTCVSAPPALSSRIFLHDRSPVAVPIAVKKIEGGTSARVRNGKRRGDRCVRAPLVRLSTGISGDRLALLGIAWKYTSPATNIFVIDVFSKLFLSQRLLPRGSHSIAISKYSQLRNHQPLGNCHQSRGNLGNDEYTHFCICR